MVGAATGRHCEIQKHDGSSETFAKSKNPGEEEKTNRCGRACAELCLDNRGRCYRQDDTSNKGKIKSNGNCKKRGNSKIKDKVKGPAQAKEAWTGHPEGLFIH